MRYYLICSQVTLEDVRQSSTNDTASQMLNSYIRAASGALVVLHDMVCMKKYRHRTHKPAITRYIA